MFANGIVKFETILNRIVEAAELAEFVVAVVIESCINCYLLTECQQFIEQLIELVLICHAAGGYLGKGRLTDAAVGALQELGRLLHGIFLTLYLYRHSTGDNAILLRQHAEVGLEWYVLISVEPGGIVYIAQVGEVYIVIQFLSEWRCEQLFINLKTEGLHLRLYLHAEVSECFFICFVGSVAGHIYLSPAGIFAYYCFQFADIFQPFFELCF